MQHDAFPAESLGRRMSDAIEDSTAQSIAYWAGFHAGRQVSAAEAFEASRQKAAEYGFAGNEITPAIPDPDEPSPSEPKVEVLYNTFPADTPDRPGDRTPAGDWVTIVGDNAQVVFDANKAVQASLVDGGPASLGGTMPSRIVLAFAGEGIAVLAYADNALAGSAWEMLLRDLDAR